jgi:hypothetical protein
MTRGFSFALRKYWPGLSVWRSVTSNGWHRFRNHFATFLFSVRRDARQEEMMDRRLFLTGMLGVAGTAAVCTAIGPHQAVAGVPAARDGILDELDLPQADLVEGEDDAQVELVRDHWERRDWRRHQRRHRRRHRRRVWRRVCHRVWRHGRRVTRCHRRRVWVWIWGW